MRVLQTTVFMALRVLVVFQLCMTSYGIHFCGHFLASPWRPSWIHDRDDLYCQSICLENALKNYEKCCVCNSCTSWEGGEIDLFIEDLSVTGANIVLSDQSFNDSHVYQIRRSYSEMKQLPINLCNNINDTKFAKLFSTFTDISLYRERIVRLNLEFNEIEELAELSCLIKLDELNLRYNRLTFLSNSSFANLTFLRIIRLDGNKLINIEPNTLSSPDVYVFKVDISKNELKTLDVTNMYTLNPFCEISYESNEIKDFVNVADFVLDTSRKYGPGSLNLQSNSVERFPDLKSLLNLGDLSEMGNVWKFGFDLRGIPITCDCSLEPFMSLAEDLIESLWRDYFQVECTAPEHLKNTPIPDIDPSMFVCTLEAESGCQTPECICVDEPNKDTLFIDCSNSDLKLFPTIPHSNYSTYVSLNLSGNLITYIPNESYLSKISVLDLSNNDILEISDETADMLENITLINLTSNNRLLQLPQAFQYRNACSTIIDNVIVDCDCDSLWIEEWLKSKGCHTSTLYCNIPEKGIVPAKEFNENDLECSPSSFLYIISIIIGSFIVISVFSSFFVYKFRYEILIVYLRMIRIGNDELSCPYHEYDIYITLDENNDIVVDWVNRYLDNYLAQSGYTVFLPYRDIPYGSIRDTEAINALKQSQTLLVILSNKHFDATEYELSLTEKEWKYGWNNFRKDRWKNIVLVNFDHISSYDISHAQVKAFLRVGCCIDFNNHDLNIMGNIRSKLDAPQRKEKAHQKINTGPPPHRENTTLSLIEIEFDTL